MSPTREHFPVTTAVSSASKGTNHPFSMDVEFDDSLTPTQQQAFRDAVGRWLKVIVAGGPPVVAGDETIDGLLILARCKELDRKGGLSANTDLDLSALRTAAGPTAGLPGKATITLDVNDMKVLDDAEKATTAGSAQTKNIGRYRVDLIAHEIGHALGLSRPVWEAKALLNRNLHTRSPVFTGPAAARAYGTALKSGPTAVPLEPFGDHEQFIAHWRQAIFHSELMTFILEDSPNVIGPVTVAALQDLGYEVNTAAAETNEIDFTGSGPVAAPPIEGLASPTLLRNHRWLNCHVRAS